MRKLPLKQYAALLCETIGDYDFPKVKIAKVKPSVTYDFSKDPDCEFEKGKNGKDKYPFNKANENPHKDIFLADNSMLCYAEKDILRVEEYIGRLLHREDLQDVADGLSNVLYWGHAQQGYRNSRVSDFRSWACNLKKTDPDELKCKLDRFKELAEELKGHQPAGEAPSGGSRLLQIKKLELPEFSQMPFVSKILMFLGPKRYPVLDTKIAKAYANSFFAPLQDLTLYDTTIPITKSNADVYDTWACWCRKIARVVNDSPQSPCNHFRAVDVERALFTLAGLKNIDEAKKACALLKGPEGWTFRGCST